MMKALLAVRFRSLAAMFLHQARQKNKKSFGAAILFGFLYLYLGAVICGMSGFMFYSLAEPYHLLQLDWLYFALAGIMSLGMALLGSVFITQNQIYEAKDNHLLLSMPIPSEYILCSRMLPLLLLNILYVSVVMAPAIVVYAIWVSFDPLNLILQVLCIPAIALLAQAFSCLLGWLLHLLMSRLNKSLASVLFMVVFLAVYWSVYYNASSILTSLLYNSQAVADALASWVWPIFAMGQGCTGVVWRWLAFGFICFALFLIAYKTLSATFLNSAIMQLSGKKRGTLMLSDSKATTPVGAILRKEFFKFIGTPVYLTNMGLGILLMPIMVCAAAFFRGRIIEMAALIMLSEDWIPLLICAVLSFLISTMSISTPTVSLEGKNLWILQSMPISPRQILLGKLYLHCVLSLPMCFAGGIILAIVFHCDLISTLLCGLFPTLLALLNGLAGMCAGLKWAKFDYISEAFPCKQSISIAVSMFGTMGITFGLGLLYAFILNDYLSPIQYLGFCSLLLAALCFGFYMLMTRWGEEKWKTF